VANNVPSVVSLIEDSLRPKFHEYIIRDLMPEVQLASHQVQHDPNSLFVETLHSSAFRNVGVGRSLYCPEDRIEEMHPELLFSFWDRRVLSPGHFTWGGLGVDHQKLEQLATSVDVSGKPEAPSASVYCGGDAIIPFHGNTRVGIVFKGLATNDKDAPALAVLSAVTGGDSRYSKDGPGRGVTTRLYKNVLQKLDAVRATATLSASYSDTGLWGVYAEAEPGHASAVAELLAGELARIKKEGISPTEFAAARARAKATFLRELECVNGLVQYLGSKASAPGTMLSPLEFVSRLDKLTAEDVHKVASSIINSNITLVGLGDVDGLPTALQTQSRLSQGRG